ncbi:MAG: histidine phosphatase family protein [Acidimicrobiia bacterium]|nr:histidine phosphatase family protein [Acidimicrobiia bacterium]
MLHLVRHGRTAHNAQRRLLGRLEVDLDPLGRRQAAAVASRLGDAEVIVASPLARTAATAAAIAEVAGVEVHLDERWLELDYGELDGTPLEDVPTDLWSQWRADPDFAPPGGESLVALAERVRPACAELLEQARHRNIVVVTHVSPIKAAVCWALGVGEEVAWRTFVAPASVTRVGSGPGGPVLHTFNDVAHLDGVQD